MGCTSPDLDGSYHFGNLQLECLAHLAASPLGLELTSQIILTIETIANCVHASLDFRCGLVVIQTPFVQLAASEESEMGHLKVLGHSRGGAP